VSVARYFCSGESIQFFKKRGVDERAVVPQTERLKRVTHVTLAAAPDVRFTFQSRLP
jgi:hypothetical protein